jgi:hypothetical protein
MSLAPPDFVPLTTRQGVTPEALLDRLGTRRLIIWGAGHLGRAMARMMSRANRGRERMSFCDRRDDLVGQSVDGMKVEPIHEALKTARSKDAFVLVATGARATDAMREATDSGLEPREDVLSYRAMARPEAVVEVTRDGEHITPARFNLALQKLATELPYLFQVELAGFPRALGHPDLPLLVRSARLVTTCAVMADTCTDSTNSLEAVVASEPSLLVLRTRTDHTIIPEELEARLRDAVRVLARRPRRSGTEVRVNYLARRSDPIGLRATLAAICNEHAIALVASAPYVEPYGRILDRYLGRGSACDIETEVSELDWDLDEALALARGDAKLPCLCQRIFPVIRPNLATGICHLYSENLGAGFLETSYEELVERRRSLPHCHACQAAGLHRLDVDVLRARHPNFRGKNVRDGARSPC